MEWNAYSTYKIYYTYTDFFNLLVEYLAYDIRTYKYTTYLFRFMGKAEKFPSLFRRDSLKTVAILYENTSY